MPTAAKLELIPLSKLQANPRNPKLHASAVIEASITRFGMVEPVIVDKRTDYLLAGHGRVDTLRAMHAAGEKVPDGITVNKAGEWLIPGVTSWASRNDREADAAIVALNRTTEVGGWDAQPLAEILSGLLGDEGGLEGIGYGADDLDLLQRQLDAEGKFTMDFTDVIDEFLDETRTGAESFAKNAYRVLRVVFPDEASAIRFYAVLGVEYDATARSLAWPFSPVRVDAVVFDG